MIINNIKNKILGNRSKTNGGYTLVELVFYVSLFAVLTLSVINAMITMTKSFRETSINVQLTQSSNIMERISREVRQASAVTVSSPTNITLTTTDSAGSPKTVQFILSGSNIQLLENGASVGNLNSPRIVVTGLTFTEITTVEGKALKIFFTVRSTTDTQGRLIDFYDTVVLRGGY